MDSRLDPIDAKAASFATALTLPVGTAAPSPTFILLRPASILAYYDPVSATLSVTPKATIAHELMHAIQRAYRNQDQADYLWSKDATATWATGVVYPRNSDEQSYAKQFMARISTPLFFPTTYCSYTTSVGPIERLT